jgi:type IV pilus assembly protein PilW
MQPNATASMHRQGGMSIIELMIAMVVGLILMAGVLSVFVSSRQSYGVNSAIAQVQENGRFALSFITKATRMAGFMGCGGGSAVTNNLKSPANTSLPYDFTTGITGFEYSGTAPTNTYNISAETPAAVANANWSPTLANNFPASGTGYPIPGSDFLVIRYTPPSNSSAAYVDGGQPPNGSQFWLTANPGLQSGDILVITNCVDTLVIQADQINGVGNDHVVVNTGNSVSPGNSVNGIPDSFIGAQVSSSTSAVFYIGLGANNSPALFEATTDASQANGFDFNELVPDVENMQVLYGVDTTGSMTPSQYVTADNVADWSTVVSVRVALLTRSNTGAVPLPTTAPAYTLEDTTIKVPIDTRLRRVFTATIGLRNRLP